MIKKRKVFKIAIDSPAAAGAGTIAKKISEYFNLFYLDTGKIYRYAAYLKLKNKKRFNFHYLKRKINSLKVKDLNNKKLLNDEVSTEASIISKNVKLRKLVHFYQLKFAYDPPKKYAGSCLDGRDITYKIIPDANLKLFITANIKIRALRRYKELKKLKHRTSYNDVLKSIKKRDKNDYNRKISPLKKTKDSILINTTNLTKRACILKIKKITELKLKQFNGSIQRYSKTRN